MAGTAKPTTHRFGIDVKGPGAILAPGTTAERPTEVLDGLTRVNTETKMLEFYSDGWVTVRGGDGYYSTIVQLNTKLDSNAKAVDSDKLDGHDSAYFAKASQVLTDVPAGAVFTDTQTPVLNTLTSTSTVDSLSANQGRILKTLIDNINSILLSDDTSLDEWQELVDFIKQNKEALDSLSVANIAGLQTALDGKLDNAAQAVDSDKLNGQLASYYTDILARLGWTPIQQGGGSGQGSAKLNIGLRSSDGQLLLQADDQDYGNVWPLTSSNAELLDGHGSAYYAKSSQVLTDVPTGAVFTDTWRPVNDTVTSTSTVDSATANSVRVAYNRGSEALAKANEKLDANGKAVDSDKLDGRDTDYFAKSSDLLTPVPENAVFTDTQTPLSNLVSSSSEATAASSLAVKTAFDKGNQALIKANLKLDFDAQAVDSDKLNGQTAGFYAVASDLLTPVPANAVFTDTQRPVINNLVSTSTEASLTANQGRVLKALIDNLASIVSSDDSALDEIQDVVNYIKQNRESLESLSVANIAGLQDELSNRLTLDATAADSSLFDGSPSSHYAKSSQVLTNVPAGAVFTDTFRPISDSISSSSSVTGASLKAVRTAYDHAQDALDVANTKMDDQAPLGGSKGKTYWQRSYTVNNVTTKEILDKNGDPLNTSNVYRVTCHINSTGTINGLVAILYYRGTDWLIHKTHAQSETSNHIQLNIIDGVPKLLTAHGNLYTVEVYHESIHGSGTAGKLSPEVFGVDGFLSDTPTGLFYRGIEILHKGNMGEGSGFDAELFDGKNSAHYAKSSQVLTDVPAGAVFTDTQRQVSDSIISSSSTIAASSKAAKVAYDRGTSALDMANTKLDSDAQAVDSDKLNGQTAGFYARSSQVLTDVPAGAVFTDTQRPVSSSINSTSTSTAASSAAAKTAYDRGTEALSKANTKLDANAQAVDSDKLAGESAAHYAKSSQVLTDVPAGAKFTDTNTWRGIHDGLTSTSSTVSLSANQGRVLKGLIDNINSILTSDDTSLDEWQELVDYIKQNKDKLEELGISNIAGLQSALDGKLGVSSKAADSSKLNGQAASYYAKSSQLLTPVPANAVFTDTQRPVSSSVSSTSTSVAANSAAVKTAYDRGSSALNVASGKLDENGTAVDSDKLGNQLPSHYAKSSQVLTNVPAGAKFTDTQRPLSTSVTSTSTSTAATSSAVKSAYDRGTSALNVANSKLSATGKAADSDKLDGKDSTAFIQTSGTQSASGIKTFNDGISVGGGSLIKYDSASDSIVFSFT